MGALLNLYTNDGRVVVGRTSGAFPVSVNTGFAVVGQLMTGYYSYEVSVWNRTRKHNDHWHGYYTSYWASAPSYIPIVAGMAAYAFRPGVTLTL